jgi:AsmA family protein
MGRWMKILSIVGVLFIALIVAGIAILKSMDFNEYKGLIAEKAKEATGRDLKIAGDLNLEISLTPKIAVEGVSFSNAEWGSRPEMVSVKKFAAEMSLLPLLSGQIEIQRVILEGVDLLAEKDKSGKANWEFGGAKPAKADKDDHGGGGDAALPVVHKVSIKDVKVTFKDAQSGASYALDLQNVDLSADGSSAPLMLDVNGVINGQAFKVGGQLGSIAALAGGDMFPLNLDIAALATTIGLDGQAGVPDGAPKADIKLALKGASLNDTLMAADALSPGLKDIKLPVSGGFHVNSQIKLAGPTKVSLENLDAGIGEISVKGRVAADLGGKRPAVDVALTTDTLDLDKLMPKSEKKDETAKTAAAPAKDKGDGRVFPKDPLPLDGLKAADAKVKFDANKIIVQGMQITAVKLGVNLNAGKLRVNPLSAGFGGGKIDGDVSLDASGKAAGLKAKIEVKGVDYGMVLTQRGITDIAEGKVDADIDVAGSGASVRQIMAGLNGKSRIVTKDGKLGSAALNLISTDLTSVFSSNDDKKIICGVIDHRITKGMANTHAVVFETGGLSVVGTGGANLADETLKMRVDPRSKKPNLASAAMVPVNIKGTFAKPDWELDAAALAGNAAAGAARVGTALATGGLSLLAEALVKKAGKSSGMIDKTDYCTPALAGKKVEPGEMAEAETKSEEKPAASSTEAAPAKKEEGGAVEGISKGLKSLFGN